MTTAHVGIFPDNSATKSPTAATNVPASTMPAVLTGCQSAANSAPTTVALAPRRAAYAAG